MDGEALALVALLGVAAYLATRSSDAGAAFAPTYDYGTSIDYGGYTLPDPDSGIIVNIAPSGEPGGASWFNSAPVTPADDEVTDFDTGSTMASDELASANMEAMLALIRAVEAGSGGYQSIAGYPGVAFTDMSDHPFVLNPNRPKPLGTTASGAYQMVVNTWLGEKRRLGLTDFSPGSQDAAAASIIMNKRPASYPFVIAGQFVPAMDALRGEWEAFDKILRGAYPVTLAQARQIFTDNGGTIA